MHQWDTFVADFEYPEGSEQGGACRSVIVVSNDGFNAAFPVVTVVSLTKWEGKKRRVYPFEVVFPAKLAGNPVEVIYILVINTYSAIPQSIAPFDRAA